MYEKKNELAHHGILGQKWGVRRFQNPDGTLTAKGRKRYYKEEQNTYINKSINYDDEYDKTDEGKKKKRAYEKELKRMYDDPDYFDKPNNQKTFEKIEEDYLRSQGRYTAKKLLNDYGSEKLSILVSRGSTKIMNDGEAAMKAIEDEWWIHAV